MREGFTFGNMTPLQTKNAARYINNSPMSSEEIANRVSGYKGAPRVNKTTISHLRTYMAKKR